MVRSSALSRCFGFILQFCCCSLFPGCFSFLFGSCEACFDSMVGFVIVDGCFWIGLFLMK